MVKYLKHIICVLLVFTMLVPSCAAAEETDSTAKVFKEFYVSPQGDDGAAGTKDAPFKTIQRAQEEVRKYNRDMDGNIVVNVAEGNYFLDEQITFHQEDSGFNGYRVIYRGEDGKQKPLISAGRPITGFTKYDKNPNLYVADVKDYNHLIKYITVNGALRRDASGVTFSHKGHWDDPESANKPDGMYVSKEDFALYENMEDMYIEWWDGWIANYVHLRDAFDDPNDPSQYIVRGYDGMFEFYALSEHEHTGLTTRRIIRPRNAFELLDEPGEFYYNRKQGKIYYMPKEGEDMSTAEVIYPVLEDIVYIVGNSNDDPVKNITIDNFRIANSKNYALEESGGARFGQLSEWKTGGIDMPSGAIDIFLADGIEVLNNEIYNVGQTGISILSDVNNCRIEGNIIRDCGDAGVMLGGVTQYYYGERFCRYPSTEYDENALCSPGVFRRVQMSYNDRDISGYLGYYRLNYVHQTWLDDTFYDASIVNKSGGWVGGPEDVQNGVRNWVRIDMREAFSWDKILLHMRTHRDPETRSHFEVLLSNDRFFEEGNYVVAATFSEPTEAVTEINAKDLGKYRYIMVRSLEGHVVELTGVYPFTSDIKPYEHGAWPEDNIVRNNVIARCGNFNYGSGNMGNSYTTNTEISYNQIQETSYSGIEMGWAWNVDTPVLINNDVHHNYIKDFGLNLFDGAAVYTTGNNGKTRVHDNLVETTGICYGTFYSDGGTGDITFEDNVCASGGQGGYMYNIAQKNVIMKNNYGTNPGILNGNGAATEEMNSEYVPVEMIVPGQETGKAKEIVENAGLQTEYKHLAKNLTDGDLGLYNDVTALWVARAWNKLSGGDSIRTSLKNQYINAATYLLENANFGNGETDYPPAYGLELESALEELKNSQNDEQNLTYAIVKMARVIDKARSVAGTTDIDVGSSGMVGVSIVGAENIKYDFKNKVAEIDFGVGSNVDGKNLNVTVSKKCELAYDTYNVKMNKDLAVPIYHKDLGLYEYWTVKIRESENYISDFGDGNWDYGGGRGVTTPGGFYIRSENSTVMHKNALNPNENTVVKFTPVTEKTVNKLSFVIGAKQNTAFDAKTTVADYNRAELVFTNDDCCLYNVENGTYTLLGKVSGDLIDWDEENVVEIGKSGNNLDLITIAVNGKMIFNELKVKSNGSYFGFYADDLAMHF